MSYKFNNQNISILEEALAVYLSSFGISPSGVSNFEGFFNDKMLVVKSIQKGVSYRFFNQLKSVASITDQEWAEFLQISTKSLQRFSKEKEYFFKPIHSEKILALAEVFYLGNRVFDSPKQFMEWLYNPSFALGNMSPFELLKNAYGKEMVVNELHRIDQGVFA